MYFPGLEDRTCVVVVNRLKDYRDGLDASSRHQKSIARSRLHAWTTEEEQILTTLTEEQKRKALVVKLGPTPFGVPGLENRTHQAVKMRLYQLRKSLRHKAKMDRRTAIGQQDQVFHSGSLSWTGREIAILQKLSPEEAAETIKDSYSLSRISRYTWIGARVNESRWFQTETNHQ